MDKSIGAEVTFDTDVCDPEVIRRALLSLADRVGVRLRDAGHAGRTVSIKVRLADFRTVNRSRTLPSATDVGREIVETAWALFSALRVTEPIRLVGVRVEGLSSAGAAVRQPALGDPQYGWREAEAVADAAAARFGRSMVRPASLLAAPDPVRRENHPRSRVVPLSDPPTPS